MDFCAFLWIFLHSDMDFVPSKGFTVNFPTKLDFTFTLSPTLDLIGFHSHLPYILDFIRFHLHLLNIKIPPPDFTIAL